MKKLSNLCIHALLACACVTTATAQRTTQMLEHGWKFSREDKPEAAQPKFNDKKWKSVTVPHDWAIYGPFSFDNDKQHLAITQDGQKEAMEHAGRTGGLPFVGVGWYRTKVTLPDDVKRKRVELRFDGAMSNAQVYVNGQFAGTWAYGYNSFFFDITPFVHAGKDNTIAVRLENKHESSRWYPGAGLYRNVHLTITEPIHFTRWGTQVTTPEITKKRARIEVKSAVSGLSALKNGNITVKATLIAPQYQPVLTVNAKDYFTPEKGDTVFRATIALDKPHLWDIKQPHLYKLALQLEQNGKVIDTDTTTFGIRSIEVKQYDGFYLNGRKIKFQGVCLHHDQGPLGGVVNEASYRRQVRIMQDMGVNAIRTSHNMPAPEFVRICDEMGMMVMAESFDSWKDPKVPNGYNLVYDEWHERDLTNLVRQFRNSASVVMWCIGNEVPEQWKPEGAKRALELQRICHREDPTRPVTNGMDNPKGMIHSGMGAVMDIPGVNYRPFMYDTAHYALPQGFILGSETASTVSSRGVYKFPVQRRSMAKYPDHQASSYDVEHCSWSNLPEDDWMRHEDRAWTMGEFVWTGFDYIGEPTPYYSDWPSHSSLFGIVDLAGIPKDRYYLYRSHWNKEENTLHVLPHWTWKGREGEVTPIFVYTNYPEAEVFINGKSQGRKKKDLSVTLEATENAQSLNDLTRQKRYRLMWMDTRYEPGTVKVVAYDKDGNVADTKEIHTAGEPDRLELSVDRMELTADGKDIAFIRVSAVDRDGNLIPDDARLVSFKVKGAGTFRAAASGNAASLDLFHVPQHHLFSGMLTALVQSGNKEGVIEFTATAKGLKPATIRIQTKK